MTLLQMLLLHVKPLHATSLVLPFSIVVVPCKPCLVHIRVVPTCIKQPPTTVLIHIVPGCIEQPPSKYHIRVVLGFIE